MTKIKEYQVTVLIIFIIASILYGIHMFREESELKIQLERYEYIKVQNVQAIYRVDRITNKVCLYIYRGMPNQYQYRYGSLKNILACSD